MCASAFHWTNSRAIMLSSSTRSTIRGFILTLKSHTKKKVPLVKKIGLFDFLAQSKEEAGVL